MNKRPELKKFVKYGGAECFQNVEVDFQHGKKAVLTIFKNGVETEQVELQALQTFQEMHDLMLAKGFQLKAAEEVERITRDGDAAFEKDIEGRRQRQEQARQKMYNREHVKTEVQPDETDHDALPDEEQIRKDQMREWKLQQWKKYKEDRKLSTAAAGEEL